VLSDEALDLLDEELLDDELLLELSELVLDDDSLDSELSELVDEELLDEELLLLLSLLVEELEDEVDPPIKVTLPSVIKVEGLFVELYSAVTQASDLALPLNQRASSIIHSRDSAAKHFSPNPNGLSSCLT
jgi:hypothetical protein